MNEQDTAASMISRISSLPTRLFALRRNSSSSVVPIHQI